jgi:sporulation protein YlmC with PRC-barrel domain
VRFEILPLAALRGAARLPAPPAQAWPARSSCHRAALGPALIFNLQVSHVTHYSAYALAPLLLGVAAGFLSAQDPPTKSGAGATLAPNAKGAARCKASQLIGCAITNSKNESLGEIQDIVLDGGNRKIAYAVISFGGFLGMGEKNFAMPWRLIEVSQRSTDDVPRATLGLDQATLKNAPGFDSSSWPDMGNAAWATQVEEYYRARGEVARPEGSAAPKDSGADGTRGGDRASGDKVFAHRRLSNLIGMDVVDLQHREIAEVEDLVVDTKFATVDGALLGFGGTLGMGEKLVLVAAEVLKLDHDKGVFVFSSSKADLEAMALPGNKHPALNTEEWRTDCIAKCAKTSAVAKHGDVIPVDASGEKSVPFADAYDLNKVETLKGSIMTIGSVRVGDQQEERLRLRLRISDGREMIVYAAPTTHADQRGLGLRPGRAVEVTGSPVKYGSQTVLVAGSIVADGKTLTLRDDKGRVTWTPTAKQ